MFYLSSVACSLCHTLYEEQNLGTGKQNWKTQKTIPDWRKLSATSTVVMFWKVQLKSNFVQAGIECRHGQLYTRESSGNTNSKTLEHDWPQQDCPVTCLSLGSFLQPPSLCAFISVRKPAINPQPLVCTSGYCGFVLYPGSRGRQ